MKRFRKTVLPVLAIALLVVVGVIGTFAFYQSTTSAQNRLMTKDSGVFLSEIFNPADEWVPGETKQKEVSFGNDGEKDQVLRVRVTEAWYDSTGAVWSWGTTAYDPSPAVINWTTASGTQTTGPDETNWIKIGDYYYYKKVLTKETNNTPTVTDNMITSVSFSDKISNGVPGDNNDFSNKRYSLTVKAETVDVDTTITASEWGVNFTNSGGNLTWTAT